MPYIKQADSTMGVERRERTRRPQASYGANKCGPIKVTKADGTVEIKPALTSKEIADIVHKGL